MCLLNISFGQMVYLKKQNPYNSYWDCFPARIMTSQTFLATEKRALDPAEIEEFYSTISA